MFLCACPPPGLRKSFLGTVVLLGSWILYPALASVSDQVQLCWPSRTRSSLLPSTWQPTKHPAVRKPAIWLTSGWLPLPQRWRLSWEPMAQPGNLSACSWSGVKKGPEGWVGNSTGPSEPCMWWHWWSWVPVWEPCAPRNYQRAAPHTWAGGMPQILTQSISGKAWARGWHKPTHR